MKTYSAGPTGIIPVTEVPFHIRYPEWGRYLAACACHQWKMHAIHGSHRGGEAFARCKLCGTGISYLRAGW